MSNYSDSEYDEENANSSWFKVYKLIEKNDTVLDIGCSSGNFGEILQKRKKCVVDGVEIDVSDYNLAKKKLHNVYRLDIEKDDLKEITDKYDVIYFGDVIEHLVDPVKVLQRVKKLLKNKGRIIFSIPNMAHISVRIMLMKGGFEYTETGLLDKTHLHYYTLDEVYRVFSEAGLEIKQIDFVEKDYPKDLIIKTLKDIGLTPNDSFLKNAKSPDASAFQFIGEAAPTFKKPKPRKVFGPIDLFESYHTDIVNALEADVNQLKDENKLLEYENQKIQKQYNELKSNIAMLKKNPAKFIHKRYFKK